jgi:hypothetical protein
MIEEKTPCGLCSKNVFWKEDRTRSTDLLISLKGEFIAQVVDPFSSSLRDTKFEI